MKVKILHEGHRQRMKKRLYDGSDMFDHEVLEVLLFEVCPRINTNPIAHALLDRFCSISEVLKADVEELKTVQGVGKNVAEYIRTVGLCTERAGEIGAMAQLKTFADCKKFISVRFAGKTEEALELYFLEKNGRVKRIYAYSSADRNKVVMDGGDILKNIALAKPYSVLASHNHLNGCTEPSANDCEFTNLLQFICSMNGIAFLDHIIYDGDEGFYSYRESGALEDIRNKYTMGNIVKWIKSSSTT